MRRFLLIVCVSLFTATAYAQTAENESDSLDTSKLVALLETLAKDQIGSVENYGTDKPTYQLFKTTNMWTFLKLNTKNGTIYQVQFGMSDGERFETFLNIVPLAVGENAVSGRFTLYPTDNMWTFILLDQIDGRTWQVQWSQDSENRGIVPIE